ncbi:hypothetical protein [Agaribacterium sp. ZY112]|uniref:hypothetical protein n=1 Tax=Agaribacterium sp. ZY112 TaxID=3233574 RepID=UPI003526517A
MSDLLLSALLIALLGLGACAQHTRTGQMVSASTELSSLQFPDELQGNIEVRYVSGAQEDNPLWHSEVNNQQFSDALKRSLAAVKLGSEEANYELDIELLRIDYPVLGFNTTVSTHIHYRLLNKQTEETYFEQKVVSPYTVTQDEAFLAAERLRLATEGSAKTNIKVFLRRLAQKTA